MTFCTIDLASFGILLKIIGKSSADGHVNSTHHLRVAKLGLGLSFKLGLGHLDRDDRCQPLTEVVTVDVKFQLGCHTGIFGILLQGARQSPAEPCKMGSSFNGVDVVDI